MKKVASWFLDEQPAIIMVVVKRQIASLDIQAPKELTSKKKQKRSLEDVRLNFRS